MRTRLYDPPPETLRQLPRDQRRRIVRAVRRGQAAETKREARIAVVVATWMEEQRRTTYLQLLSTPICVIAIAALLALGWMTWRNLPGMIGNVVPFLAIMFALRWFAWFYFRHAPEALEANLDLTDKKRRKKRR